MNRSVKQSRGVTLLELMIVLAIIGIIAGFAFPQYGGLMKRQGLLAESKRITSLLKLARSEARARASYVVLSKSGASWSGDIQVYDAPGPSKGNRSFVAADASNPINDEMIRDANASGRVISADSSVDEFITFGPKGWSEGGAFTIAICNSATDAEYGRFIEVNRVGKINERAMETADDCTQ